MAMNEFGMYLLESSINLAVLYVVFWLIARKSSFHHINRWLLLTLVMFAVTIPLLEINVSGPLQHDFYELDLNLYEELSDNVSPILNSEGTSTPSNVNYWLYIYLVISSILLLRFLWQIQYIFQLRRKSDWVNREKIKVYLTQELTPFSFFNWIFIPQNLDKNPDVLAVIIHEKAHGNQGHSWDLIFIELLSIVFWFNPVLWFWRRFMKRIHEYLADQAVIQKGYPLLDYLLILKRFLNSQPSLSISHSFSSPTIIHRFRMLNHSSAKPYSKLTYLIFLPVMVSLLVACTFKEELNSKIEEKVVKPISMTVVDSVAAYPDLPMSTAFIPNPIPSISPLRVEHRITSEFGMRDHPQTKERQFHLGIDFGAPEGTPVLATADGVVTVAKMFPKYGNKIKIDHGEGYVTLFAHLQGFNVKKGQQVKQGEVIGYVGNTGYSKGPHLHYEVIKNNKRVNPSNYMPQ